MTIDEMELALAHLGHRLKVLNQQTDIVIAGGAWMALILGSREVTKDIDAYLSPPTEPIRRAAQEVAQELSLPPDWLNDGIKGFFFETTPHALWREFEGLRVYAVTADYMLALKVYAARLVDCPDLQALARHLHVSALNDVLEIVQKYIPASLLTARHRYFAEACLDEGTTQP
jgi:predicted nucleotidyltransferase